MGCDLCGKNVDLVRANVEGTELMVCAPCGRHGRILKRPVVKQRIQQAKKPEIIEMIVDNYAQLIRHAREKKGMTQKAFANALNEKESIIQKMESGGFRPLIQLARKLERMLNITLIETREEQTPATSQKASGPLTIGDLIKLKR